MNHLNHQPHAPAFGISLADIYFILFRHKRAIILLSLLGMGAGAGYFMTQQPPYQSDAMVLIKYITQSTDENAVNNSAIKIKETTDLGLGVVMAEAKILSSFDLFNQVVTNIGAEKILAKAGGGADATKAGYLIQKGLKVIPGKDDGVIAISFTHPDAQMVTPILNEVIRNYKEMSSKIHSPIGITDEVLDDQINTLRLQIANVDEEIKNAKTNAGIVDLTDSKKFYSEEFAKLRRELNQLEIEMATSGRTAQPDTAVNASTNKASTNTVSDVPTVAAIEKYKRVVSQLMHFQRQEDDYLFKFGYTESNKLVIENRGNIDKFRTDKLDLESKYPSLADMVFPTVDASPANNSAAPPVIVRDYSPDRERVLRKQLAALQVQINKLDDAEAKISDLERKKQTLESNYKYYTVTRDTVNIKAAMGPGHISNISVIQWPKPPFKEMSKYYKAIGALVMGGLMMGLFWAFLYEFYIDRSVKRASEIETKLNIPFFLAIPALGKADRKQLSGPSRKQLGYGGETAGGALVPAPLEVNSALVNHALDKHYDALRDRLVTYFESINLTRKPKLVAVTSASRGAGVSTIASGLAASLSETGDGRVLLVDMNHENGSAQQFFHGKANCKLDDALLRDKRDEALVQERLYVVSEGSASDKLSRVLPKRFASLVPQLKASDYDYIIFDMPPVSQTSITTRLAGFMDTVMLVIESEKTDRESVQQANSLLAHTKANVTAVLNKTQQHVPKALVHDINSIQ